MANTRALADSFGGTSTTSSPSRSSRSATCRMKLRRLAARGSKVDGRADDYAVRGPLRAVDRLGSGAASFAGVA